MLVYDELSHYGKFSLKEKSGAEMAPGWSRFHDHRLAPI